jgi:hypothetical protein
MLCFTGNFLNLKAAGTTNMHVTSAGKIFASLTAATGTFGICHSTNGAETNVEFTDCNGAPGDLAENFGTTDSSIEAGDVVIASGEAYSFVDSKNTFTSKAWINKAAQPYQANLLGVISTQPNQLYADDVFNEAENPRPVTLVGRVPVKVVTENGPIVTGDLLTSSSIPGVAMKATSAGMVIGQALSSYSADGVGKVVLFVNPFFYSPGLMPTEDGSLVIQGGSGSIKVSGDTDQTALVVNQAGSGDLLQLQAAGLARLLVKNDGTAEVNAITADPQAEVLAIKNGDHKIFTINARGDVGIVGVIRVDNEQFAGSVTTDSNGEAVITFDYDLGTGKPVVELTVESSTPTLAQVSDFSKDTAENYTGFTIKTFTAGGEAVSTMVHYLVIAKPTGYATKDVVINVVNSPNPTFPASTFGATGEETPVLDTPTEEPPAENQSATLSDDGQAPEATPVESEILPEENNAAPVPEPAPEAIIISETSPSPVE